MIAGLEAGSESKRFVDMNRQEQTAFAEEKLGNLIADPGQFKREYGYVDRCIADIHVIPGNSGIQLYENREPYVERIDDIDPSSNLVAGTTYWGREFKTIGAESDELRALMACIGDSVPVPSPDFPDSLTRVVCRLNIPGRPPSLVTIVTETQPILDLEVDEETPTKISYRTNEIIVAFRVGI